MLILMCEVLISEYTVFNSGIFNIVSCNVFVLRSWLFSVLGKLDSSTESFTSYLETLERFLIRLGNAMLMHHKSYFRLQTRRKSPYIFLLWARILMQYVMIYAAQIHLKANVFRSSVTS